MIYLSAPHLTGEEQPYLQQVFESNWITSAGHCIDLLEQRFQEKLSVPYAVALNSGTSAIHLGLKGLGIGAGDTVISPTFTFVASANPIVYQQATPIFVDSEPLTWNLDPVYLEEAIKTSIKKGKKPKAIVVVYLYGQPAQMERIQAIAEHYDIPILEDAAEALGSSWQQQKLGGLGDVGVISLNGNKIITASGGGILLTKEEAIAQKVKFWATQAREPVPYYQHTTIGYNYSMSNVLAAIACGQMEVLEDRVTKRRSIFQYYQKHLKEIAGIHFWEEPTGCFSNRWLSCILLSKDIKCKPEQLIQSLWEAGIEARRLWKPMHLQPLYNAYPYFGEQVAEDLFERGLCLPSSSSLTEAQLDYIIEQIRTNIKK
ncbi:MAG: DegT/DnrJ/EryC1/StrS family aminotransferase [Thermonemataceae bacterium]